METELQKLEREAQEARERYKAAEYALKEVERKLGEERAALAGYKIGDMVSVELYNENKVFKILALTTRGSFSDGGFVAEVILVKKSGELSGSSVIVESCFLEHAKR